MARHRENKPGYGENSRKREAREETLSRMAIELKALADDDQNLLDSVQVRRTLARLLLYQLADNPLDQDIIRLLVSILGTRAVGRGVKGADRFTPAQAYSELLKDARAATA